MPYKKSNLRACFAEYDLNFKFPAGTSRGVLTRKTSFFIVLHHAKDYSKYGLGECGHIPGLSLEPLDELRKKTKEVCENINLFLENGNCLENYPSLKFALETALLDLQNGGNRIMHPSGFTDGSKNLPINGLIWMGDSDSMKRAIDVKLTQGYRCLKLKIGSLEFEEELRILRQIRKSFSPDDLELRLDANGAFSSQDAKVKLQQLAEFQLHSLEQPVAAGQWELMEELCQWSCVPIALDEELIPVRDKSEREKLVKQIKPQYLVLKPGLLGGAKDCENWIELIKSIGGNYWITSALESNVGLNAIAQWTYLNGSKLFQGLGTGQIYQNNFPSPLTLESGGQLKYDALEKWDLKMLDDSFEDRFSLVENIKIRDRYIYLRPSFKKDSQLNDKMNRLMTETTTPVWQKDFAKSVQDWISEDEGLELSTSGSTSAPKTIRLSKQQALSSAKRTLDYLNIPEGQRLLLCLPAKFVGGFMIIVRAFAGNHALTVMAPQIQSLEELSNSYCLASFTPYQIRQVPEVLKTCQVALLGGEKVDPALEKEILRFTATKVFETFGMTETISHIALREIGKSEPGLFELLTGVTLKTNEKDEVIITDEVLNIQRLKINDVIELVGERKFKWLGRRDNVINSGGIKILVEILENKIRELWAGEFFITGMPDDRLGQTLAIVVKIENFQLLQSKRIKMREQLGKYEMPKFIGTVEKMIYTETSKINRTETLNQPINYQAFSDRLS